VKSADVNARLPAKRERPLAHFLGGFVCERYRADMPRSYPGINERRYAVSYYASLAAAWACKYKERAGEMKNRLSLRRGQLLVKLFIHRHPGRFTATAAGLV
jgi:hypothetical protein